MRGRNGEPTKNDLRRRIRELEYGAQFLCERLREYEADGCQCDQSVREWSGHVTPALARMEMALTQKEASAE